METLKQVNSKTKEAYNKAASRYFELFHDELEHKQFDRELILDFLENFDSDSVLCDVGCGPCGHIENFVTRKGINIVGIDISEKCVEIAQEHFPDIRFEVGDLAQLDYSDDYFDGIISYYSIIDTPKIYIDKVFKEFNRVLKKGGLLFLVVKEGETEGYEKELLGVETEVYFSLFTEKEIEACLKKNNFKIMKSITRIPYEDEIKVNRIFSISKKI